MDNEKQTVRSGNGSGQKKSPTQLKGTYIHEDNQQHGSILHSGSNAFVRIKIRAILMKLWHFEGKRPYFVGHEVTKLMFVASLNSAKYV
jgi:hypothetical protein